jgi:ABC-type glycerol-3-phosphate transport system substrate-binding protein
MMDKIDYNHNGIFESLESLRAVKEGFFDPVTQDNIKEMLRLMKEVYNEIYIPGWETADGQTIWNSGNVGIKTDLLGAVTSERSNTNRKFDYGIFPTPTVTSRTSTYVKDIPNTNAGPYQPSGGAGSTWNVIKPMVENNKGMQEAAIAFLKFVTVPENLNELILENGFILGAVKGVAIPPALQEYMNQPFPTFTVQAPRGFTTEMNQAMSKELEMWVKGQTNDAAFFANWNRYQQQGADDFIKLNRVDTSGWK